MTATSQLEKMMKIFNFTKLSVYSLLQIQVLIEKLLKEKL